MRKSKSIPRKTRLKRLYRGWANFNMPRPFNTLVQNAVVAEPRSVKIGALVGENGRWYAFGKMIVDL